MDGPQSRVDENLVGSGSTSSKSVPIEHLDYGYIGKCENVKELEKILRALGSGQAGYYPDLINFCEERIATLDPRSKVLRKDKPPASSADFGKEEWQKVNSDFKDWAAEMGMKSPAATGLSVDDEALPPIRKPATVDTQEKKKGEENEWGKPSPDRIKSSDYRSWDKFDPEKAAEEADLKKYGKEKAKPSKVKATMLPSSINTEGMSDKERVLVANKEKDKGNEAFKAGDFEESVQYYTRSISVIPSAPAYNNRSLARIKLGQFIAAVEDCTRVLEFEPENIKALLRRGTARKSLRELTLAKGDLQAVLKAEPNNRQALDLLEDLLAKEKIEQNSPKPYKEYNVESLPKGRRMVIQEVEGDSDSESDSESEEEDDEEGQGSLVNGTGSQNSDESGTDGARPSVIGQDEAAMATPQPSHHDTTVQSQSSKDPVDMATPSMPVEVPALPLPNDVIALKNYGNELFKAGQYDKAMENYSLAIQKLLPDKESFSAALATLFSNRAACNSKTGHLKETIEDCSAALDIQPYSVKAMLRRGAAYEGLEKYRHAYVDYQGAMKLDTSNQSAQSGAARMMRILSDQDGPKWREKLPPSLVVLGLPLPPPTLTTMAPSNASLPGATTTTTNASNKPAMATSTKPVSSLGQPQSEVKGQEDRGPDVKGQGVEPKDQPGETGEPSVDVSGGHSGSARKVKDGSEVKGKGEPTVTPNPKLTAEENFMKLKAEGNALVQQGNFAKALEYYTACIAVDPTLPASYTNRALCFIKLLKGCEAEADCTRALELNDTNIKALYRRALARKMLHKYSEGARDLTSLLKIEPTNASAKKELELIKELWRQKLKNNQQKAAEKPKKTTQPTPPTKSDVKSEVNTPEVDSTKANTTGVKQAEAKSSGVKPTEGKSAEVRPAEVRQAEVKPADVRQAEVKPTEVKPTEVKPAECKPAGVKPAGVKPAGAKPAGAKPAEVKPAGVKPAGVKPAGVKSEKKKKKGKRMKIQEVEGSSEEENDAKKSSPKPAEKAAAKEKKGGKTPKDTGSQKGCKNPGGDDNKISVPKLTKVTAYEFLQAWTSLKRHRSMQAYAELLKQLSPDELPDVLTNKLDGDMLVNIVKAVCEHLVDIDGDLSYGLLANLPKVERFKMVVLFLSTSDKKRLRNSVKKLGSRKTDAYTELDIEKIRQHYSL